MATCKDLNYFVPYGDGGRVQYSKDFLSGHSTAKIAAVYVIKALCEKGKYEAVVT